VFKLKVLVLRRNTAAIQYTSNMAAVTVVDRMTSLSPQVYSKVCIFVEFLVYILPLSVCLLPELGEHRLH